MLHLRGLDTVRITKVKGHADEATVLDGRVIDDDRLGNDAADEAADFGRRRVGNADIDARRSLSGVCGRWYPSLPFLVLLSIMMVEMVPLDPLGMVCWCSSQEASAGSCCSGPGILAWATWYLGLGMGECASICFLC